MVGSGARATVRRAAGRPISRVPRRPCKPWRAARARGTAARQPRRGTPVSRTGRRASQWSSGATGSANSPASQSGSSSTVSRGVPAGSTICRRRIGAPAARPAASSTCRGSSDTMRAPSSARPCSRSTSAGANERGGGGGDSTKPAPAGSRMRATKLSSPMRKRAVDPADPTGSAAVCIVHTMSTPSAGSTSSWITICRPIKAAPRRTEPFGWP